MSEERRQRFTIRLAIGLGSVVLACAVLAILALWLRPRQFTTHRDAIAYALDRHGIAYQQVYIDHAWPDTVHTERFAANLDVRLSGGRQVFGLLACRSGRTRCSFSVTSLGIEDEPLPELVDARREPWIVWLEQALDDIVGDR
jgi:hypothetical protein